MTTKKKTAIILIFIIALIVICIGLFIRSLGMMRAPSKYTAEEVRYCKNFEKSHPVLKLECYYGGDTEFLFISHESKNKLDSLYYIKLNKKELADSIARTFSIVPHKFKKDSLFVVFSSKYTDTIHSKYYETRDVEFHYKGSK